MNRISLSQIPNILSTVRIICVPIIVVFMWFNIPTYQLIAAILYTLAAITDLVDGYIARKYNVTSPLGILLDPLADKLLFMCAVIMLIPVGLMPAWLAFITIAREILVTGMRGMASSKGIYISASKIGKQKTLFFNVGTIGMLIGNINFPYLNIERIGFVVFLVGAVLSIVSGIDYIIGFKRNIISKLNVKDMINE